MSDNPLDPQFWSAEEAAFWEVMGPLIVQIMMRGATSGTAALPADVAIFMNWDVFNQAALDWLNRYRLTWVRSISQTTRDQFTRIIGDWIQAGDPLPVLQSKLAALGIVNENRAASIAVTEVTRAYAEGNIMAWRSAGVVGGKQWRTARDERVCPICGPLDGMIVSLDGNGFTTEIGGIGVTGPPIHVRCRCWLTPIVSEDLFADELRRILEQ